MGSQDAVVTVDSKAIDTESMAAGGGFGVFENWVKRVRTRIPRLNKLFRLGVGKARPKGGVVMAVEPFTRPLTAETEEELSHHS